MNGDLLAAAAALSRRSFLRVAAGAAAGLAAGGCGTSPFGPPPDATLRVLSPHTWAAFTAATARLVGPRGATLVARGAVVPGRAADAILAANAQVAAPMVHALWLLEAGVWPLVRKVRRFTNITPGAQDAVLRDLEHSHLMFKRDVFAGIRALAFMSFYGDAGSRQLTGYPGPWGSGAVGLADGMARAEDLV